jgi:hypothetical protein
MSCCGDQRTALREESVPTDQRDFQFWTPGPTDFEYSGYGELTVTGPLTGTIYRFTANNRRVRVHGSDAASLLSVPGLKPVQ